MRKTVTILITLIFIGTMLPGTIPTEQETNDLPNSFSWRNINGVDYTTPIKDQSPAPTCEAYALCAALETIMQYKTRDLYQPDLSETHLYFYAGGTYEKGGVNVHDAADYLIDHGVPDEGCYPDPHRPFDYPYTSVEGWENRTVKITDWGWVPHEKDAIKEALIKYGPLTICIFVYDDMFSYKGGIYKRSTDKIVGGHLVSLMGYNDTTESWLVKNSWGTRWGDNGWFHMGYDQDMFIDGCYGGETGIIYVDGVYGNFNPDVPKINLESHEIYHSYIYDIEFPQILRKGFFIQEAAPRIIGPATFKISAQNTEKIEFYVDNEYQTTDENASFEWTTALPQGLHTIKAIAYDEEGDISRDMIDVFVII